MKFSGLSLKTHYSTVTWFVLPSFSCLLCICLWMINGIENSKFIGHSSWLHDSPQIQLWTSVISWSSFFRHGGEKKMYEEVIVIKCVDSRLTPTLFNSYLPDLKTIHPFFCVSQALVKQKWGGAFQRLLRRLNELLGLACYQLVGLGCHDHCPRRCCGYYTIIFYYYNESP